MYSTRQNQTLLPSSAASPNGLAAEEGSTLPPDGMDAIPFT